MKILVTMECVAAECVDNFSIVLLSLTSETAGKADFVYHCSLA